MIGRKILEIAVHLISRFPNTTAGLVISLLLSILVWTIPVLGTLFGPFLIPLLLSASLTMGYLNDLKHNPLKATIEKDTNIFEKLKTK